MDFSAQEGSAYTVLTGKWMGVPTNATIKIGALGSSAYFLDPTPFDNSEFSVRDVNDDGKLDVLTVDQFLNVIALSPGNGDGTFQPPSRFASGYGPLDLALADLGSPMAPPDGSV